MHISKKSEYAIRALISIAQHDSSTPVQITELSKQEKIPVKFLEQILLALRKADLLTSKRGVGGGYTLNRMADSITVGEVIRLMDGPIMPVSSEDDAGSAMHAYMTKLQTEISKLVDDTTIEKVIAMGRRKDGMFFEI